MDEGMASSGFGIFSLLGDGDVRGPGRFLMPSCYLEDTTSWIEFHIYPSINCAPVKQL